MTREVILEDVVMYCSIIISLDKTLQGNLGLWKDFA